MAIIVAHVKKNIVDNVLFYGRSRMNPIKDGLRKKLGLPPPQPAPFNLWMIDFSFNKPLVIPILG
jgi:hypothetical protein